MRHGRLTVPSFALILAGLLAASLAPWSIAAVVTSSPAPAEVGFVEAGAATPTLDGDTVVAVDSITKSSWTLSAPGSSRFVATPARLSRTDCDPPGAHAGRAPPLA